MEGLFQLKYENMNHLLPRIKENLMSTNDRSKMSLLEELKNLLKSQNGAVVTKLIEFDVISDLCNVLQTCREPLRTTILECLSLASEHRKFYERDASEVLSCSLRLTYCIGLCAEKELSSLEKLLRTIRKILFKAKDFLIDIDNICATNQILSILKNLNRKCSSHAIKFTLVDILYVVLAHVRPDECEDEDEKLILDVCSESINSMKIILDTNYEDEHVSNAIVALCCVCASSIRFCHEDCLTNVDQVGNMTPLRDKVSLSESVYTTMMHTIIPYVKITHFNQENSFKCYYHFVSCINSMYNTRNSKQEDIANHLAANGYLKCLLRLSIQFPLYQRRNTCILLTRTLTTLAKYSLSIDKLPEGVNLFSSKIFDGLFSLPNDSEQWKSIVGISDYRNTALMILLYYHYHATRELDVISFESLIKRSLKLETFRPTDPLTLKPLWFLFAVSFLSHPSPNNNHEYVLAMEKLTTALRRSEFSECYTHHIELIHFCLKCPEISNDLRYKVMDMWLIESDGDILPLLKLDCRVVVRHCLLIIVENGCLGSGIVRLAAKGIRQLMRIDDNEEISDIVWNMLPKVLSSKRTTPDQDEYIKVVLELSCSSEPAQLSSNTMKECANALIKIILTEETDVNFQKLLTRQAYVILVASMARNHVKILPKYLNEPKLLKKLCDYAFSDSVLDLSAIAMEFLAFIIHVQSRFSFECKESLLIPIGRLYVLLSIARKSSHARPNALTFFHELLNEKNVGMAVTLKEFTLFDEDEVTVILDIYEMLHVIHWKSTPGEREIVYQCLVDVLKFCHVKAETLMYHLCTVISNYDLVIGITKSPRSSHNFLHFVTAWLRYRKKYCDDEAPDNSRSFFESPFDKTMKGLTEYVLYLENENEMEASTRLRQALKRRHGYIENEMDMKMRVVFLSSFVPLPQHPKDSPWNLNSSSDASFPSYGVGWVHRHFDMFLERDNNPNLFAWSSVTLHEATLEGI